MSAMRRGLWLLAACLWLAPAIAAERSKSAPLDPARREALADMLLQLEQLQVELRELRGRTEVQANEIEALKARQRDVLADIDRRVGELERRGTTAPGAAAKPGGSAVPTEAATADLAKAQQLYDAAFAQLKQGRYEQAARQFREFVKAHPNSPLADNAQYWIGESAYVVRNFKLALDEFGKLLQAHPDSPKAPDALLKMGYAHYELADWTKARETLNQVVVRYPNTPVARSAEQRLAKLTKEKR